MASKPTVAHEVHQTATAYLIVNGAAAAIEFYKKAFGAVEVLRLDGPGPRIGHAEIRIGNSSIYLSDEHPEYGVVGPQTLGGSPVKMSLSIGDSSSAAPAGPSPTVTCMRSGCSPAASRSFCSSSATRGVSSDGFRTTALPVTNAPRVSTAGIEKG